MGQAILIIEDEATLAKNVRIFLERDDYEVRVAESAEEGLALMDVFRPDAVVLDFNLPGIDGVEALERIRAIDPDIKVIMVTGHGSVELAVEAMKRGAFDFLTKPVPLGKLKVLLEKAFGEARRDSALEYYQRKESAEADLDSLRADSRFRALMRTQPPASERD